MKDNDLSEQAPQRRCPAPHVNATDTTAVIQANWHRLSTRGPNKTLALLKRKFPQFRLYRCYGPGFAKQGYIATAKGTIGKVIIEPYLPERTIAETLDSAATKAMNNRQGASGTTCGLSTTV